MSCIRRALIALMLTTASFVMFPNEPPAEARVLCVAEFNTCRDKGCNELAGRCISRGAGLCGCLFS